MADHAPMSLVGSLLYGLAHVLHPRMLWLMLWPMLVSLAIWGALAIALWRRLALWLAELLDFGSAALIAAHVALVLVVVPLVYLTALFILGVFGMPKMVDYVAQRSFPALERRHGGGLGGSLWNGVSTLGGMAILFVVTLPLWLLPPLWPLIPLGIFTWVNQRLLRHDALCEHAEREEMARIFRERRGALLALGLLLALLAYVPFVGFIGPVVFGLAFIRYLLAALQELRAGAKIADH
jgi:CysZ protein